jgi:uncharacterized protein YkwD
VRFSKHVLTAFVAFSFVLASVSTAEAGVSLTRPEASILVAVNATRAANGLQPLVVGPTLQRAARAHSADMARNGYFAHGAFSQRLASFGVRSRTIGENLAWGTGRFAAAQVVVSEWLASPAHRANLLRPGFRRIGIGAAVGSAGGYHGARLITADFAGK